MVAFARKKASETAQNGGNDEMDMVLGGYHCNPYCINLHIPKICQALTATVIYNSHQGTWVFPRNQKVLTEYFPFDCLCFVKP